MPRRTGPAPTSQYVTASVIKALDVLDTLADAPGGFTLSELARRQGVPVATLFRILATLGERGYVEKDGETGRYRLTLRMWEVSPSSAYNGPGVNRPGDPEGR